MVKLHTDARPELSSNTGRHNLPMQRAPLIGREAELNAAQGLLLRDDVGLLTLTGAAGTGKTRLALQLAADVLAHFADGAFFVALAPISDPTLIAAAIIQTLGLQDVGGRPPGEILADHLRDRQMLLVLDNFEHVLEARALVTDLLASSPRLKILVTTRAPLHLQGEHEFPVKPLALPDLRRLPSVDDLARYAAVALFIRQASAVNPDFALTDGNAAAVAEICHRLDGLPLAIELAAARVKLLSPRAMLGRLERRLPLLVGGARDLPARHQTLRGAIDWSHELLDEGQRRLFRRLAVFVGGCTLEAAEAVCRGAGDLGLDLLEGIGALVDRSLLRQEEQADDEPRFLMLETIREYALERLEASGEAADVRRRHAAYYLTLAEAAAEKVLASPDRGAWLVRLGWDQENLRAAMAWSQTEIGAGEIELRLAGALFWPWRLRGQLGEARGWLERALARAAGARPTGARAKALHGAGILAWLQGDYAVARSRLEASVGAWRAVGDRRGLAYSLTWLGLVARSQGDYAARASQEESVAMFREIADKWGLAYALHFLGGGADALSDPAASRAHLEESVAIYGELGDRWGFARPLRTLGVLDYQEGNCVRARSRLEEALAIFREAGDTWNVAGTLKDLTDVVRGAGDHREASALYGESLVLFNELGDKGSIARGLEGLGGVAAAEQQSERSARLFGAAEALREAVGAHLDAADRAELDRNVAAARTQFAEAAFAAAWQDGRTMPLDRAVQYALAGAARRPRDAAASEALLPGDRGPSLTRREREVAALIARALTNREIAAELVIAERTAETHVEHILAKLGLSSRTQVATWTLEHGLVAGPPS